MDQMTVDNMDSNRRKRVIRKGIDSSCDDFDYSRSCLGKQDSSVLSQRGGCRPVLSDTVVRRLEEKSVKTFITKESNAVVKMVRSNLNASGK